MKIFLTIVTLILSLGSVTSSYAAELESPYLDQFEQPNPLLFESVLKGFDAFKEQRPYKSEWQVNIDRERGTIETNWFPEHKAEVKLKVQIVVWGSIYRVDVWQLTGLLRNPSKTTWSMRFERNLQNEIEKHNKANSADAKIRAAD